MTSHNINAARVNWHPLVHQRFYEDLYFVLFRFAGQQFETSTLQGLMADAGIRSYSAYLVFGYFDGLIRVWLSPHHWQRFLRTLSRRAADFPESRYLKIASLRYLWHQDRTNLLAPSGPSPEYTRLIENDRDAIRRVAQNPDSPPPADVVDLIGKGLLVLKPDEPDARIKSFALLQPTGASFTDPSVASEEIVAGLLTDDTFQHSSLYSGEGTLASHLIRLTLADYRQVLRATNNIAAAIARLPLRTMTLLVADTTPFESDNTNNLEALTGEEHFAADLLDVSVDALAQVNESDRYLIDRLTKELLKRLGETAEWDTAQSILRACIIGDRRLVRQHLSFVLDFEYFFREFVKSVLKSAYGPDWDLSVQTRFAQIFKNVPEPDRKDANRWPLGVVHSVLRAAYDDQQMIKAIVLSKLGETWSASVRDVLNLRNDFAHGRVPEQSTQLDDFSGEWGRTIIPLLNALPLYHALYTAMSEKEQP